jgi:hypothetical protein
LILESRRLLELEAENLELKRLLGSSKNEADTFKAEADTFRAENDTFRAEIMELKKALDAMQPMPVQKPI